MPFLLPAAAATTAIGTTAAAAGALGTGLAAGTALAGGAGIAGLMGGMGALGGAGTAGSVLGALAPGVASTIAPAAASQLAGTVGASVIPGLQGGMGALAPSATPGLTGSALQSAGLNTLKSQALQGGLAQMPAAVGGYNPAMAQNLGAQFLQNAPPIAKPFGAETMLAGQGTPNVIQQAPNLTTQMQAAQLKSAGAAPLPADTAGMSGVMPGQNFMQNLGNFIQNPSVQGAKDYAAEHPYATSAAVGLGAQGLTGAMKQKGVQTPESNAMIRPYTYDRTQNPEAYAVSPTEDSSERTYFNEQYVAGEPYKADKKAEGGIAAAYAMGGPVEQMSAMNAIGANTGYPMANINSPVYSNPMVQRPEATNVIAPSADAGVGAFSGEPRFAAGGISTLGGYSDGGRLLKGPGDGVSDSIPATIAGRQPARLADNEFVIPARIVSEIGNGSTDAGARKLYQMMDRVQKRRAKTVGRGKVAVDSGAHKELNKL